MQVISRSKIVQHRRYPELLHLYNEEFARTEGKISNNKFFDEVVVKIMPDVSKPAWYNFIKKVRTTAGMVQATYSPTTNFSPIVPTTPISPVTQSEHTLERALISNDAATQQGITTALNLGNAFYQALWKKYNETPELLTPFEQKCLADALHKAMKSQDSRIHAIKSVKEDNREQAKFDRAFQGASFD